MQQRQRTGGRRMRLWILAAINAAVVACVALQAMRVARPQHADPPQYMLQVGAAARARGAQAGELAPDFTLRTLDGSRQVSLSSFRGKSPVVLVFGSYTCPIFRGRFEAVNRAYSQYKDQAQFLFIYIREAHPQEDGLIPENKELGPISEPKDIAERSQVAQTCAAALKVQMPILVDDMDNSTETSYHVWPERMLLVDTRGVIVYAGDGPGDVNTEAMSAALERLLQTGNQIASAK